MGVVLVVILIIALVGWSLSFLGNPAPFRQLAPVPDDVPPAGAQEVPSIDVNAPGRTSDKLSFWAEPIAEATGIPEAAVRAYGNAELIAQQAWPQCNVRWNTIAGIGWVETRHGTYTGRLFEGAQIEEDGVVRPKIIGIPLDGSPGVAEIPDTDGGKYDGDTEYDRAVGPMQFIPDSWQRYGLDASGDGYADPHHIDDAALATANHLCDQNRDMSTAQGWSEAVFSYNRSEDYMIKVRDAAASYALGQPA